jgi:hypothetical protein
MFHLHTRLKCKWLASQTILRAVDARWHSDNVQRVVLSAAAVQHERRVAFSEHRSATRVNACTRHACCSVRAEAG